MNISFTLVTIYLIAFAGYASISWLFPVIPYYATSLNIGVADIGLIVSVYSYVNAIGILPCGILSDRWGRRAFLISGLIISTVAPFLYPFARDIWTLYIVRALHGLGSSLFIPTALAIVTDISPPGEHGRAMGWYTSSSQLGLMAGPIAGGFLLQHLGFEAAFYGCGLIPLLSLVFVATRMHAIPQKPISQPLENLHPWKWIKNRGAIISLLTLIMVAVGSSTVGTFVPLYARENGISEIGAGLIIASCYVSSTVLRVPSGAMADKFGNAPMILIGVTLSAIALAFLPFFHALYPLMIVALFFGAGMGFSMPAALSWLAYLSPADKRGFSMGLGAASFQAGLAFGATAMGIIVQNSGYTSTYLTAAGALGLSAIVTAVLLKFRKSQEQA